MKRIRSSSEAGSMAPLGIGLFAISLSFVLTSAGAGSLFIFQKRLTNYAEMAALFVTSQDRSATEFQSKVGNENLSALDLKEEFLEDGITVKVTACADWFNPVSSYLGVTSERVCSNASARSG